jgi:hypothetical protein
VFQAIDAKQAAIDVVKDPSSSTEAKRSAKQAIARINSTLNHREKIGRKPSRKNFQPGIAGDDEYREAVEVRRSELDRIAIEKECGRILDSHGSTPLQRHNAKKKLDALNPPPPDVQPEADEKKPSCGVAPRREDFGFQSGHDWPEFVALGKEAEFQAALAKWSETAPPPSDPRVVAFLSALDDESVKITQPVVQPVAPKAPIAPATDPALYCESCRVPFSICGCDTTTCPLCLNPRSRCYFPCQNTRRR